MKQKENKKRTYVMPQAELVVLEHCSLLLQEFSGQHHDAGNDTQPLHAKYTDFFDAEEEEEEDQLKKNIW